MESTAATTTTTSTTTAPSTPIAPAPTAPTTAAPATVKSSSSSSSSSSSIDDGDVIVTGPNVTFAAHRPTDVCFEDKVRLTTRPSSTHTSNICWCDALRIGKNVCCRSLELYINKINESPVSRNGITVAGRSDFYDN